jgi:isoleucyl-tRNA synthetase
LDRWILTRLHLLIQTVTSSLDKYEITDAGRQIDKFIQDLSQWYIRRSRERIKSGQSQETIHILRLVLLTLSKLLAPFTPFTAEDIYKTLRGEKESVHLDDWPRPNKKYIDQILLSEMNTTRELIELAHALRFLKNIKVRQPLQTLELRLSKKFTNKELLEVIAEELNVKEVKIVTKLSKGKNWVSKDNTAALNIEITSELKEEGTLRELIRQINALRKEQDLTIKDKVDLIYDTESPYLDRIIQKHQSKLAKSVIAKAIRKSKITGSASQFKIGDSSIRLKLQ